MRWLGAALLVGCSLVFGVCAALNIQRQDQRGGPPGVFHKTTPDHTLSIIQANPTANSVTLTLLTQKELKLELKTNAKASEKSLTLAANSPKTLVLSGLKPGQPTSYAFTYEGGEQSGTVTGKPTVSAAFTFVIQADSHLDQSTSLLAYEKSLNAMAADQPAFLMDLGDTFMTGKHPNYEEAITQYRAQHYFMSLVRAPVFLVLGNHDGEQGWTERNQPGMSPWSAHQRKSHFPPLTGNGDTDKANYFSFEWGDALFIALDPFNPTKVKPARSGDGWLMTLGDEQYRWLESTLAKSKSKIKFVFIHHMVSGSGKDSRGGAEASEYFEWGGKSVDGTSDFAKRRPNWSMPIHNLLKKHGVQAVFHGHDHFFAKQERDGIIYQLVPQPSHTIGNAVRDAETYSYKAGTLLGGSGYVRVRVEAEKAMVEYVMVNGDRSGTKIPCSYELR